MSSQLNVYSNFDRIGVQTYSFNNQKSMRIMVNIPNRK